VILAEIHTKSGATVQVFHGQVHYFNNYWSNTQLYDIGISKLANVLSENGALEGGGTYVQEYIPETGPLTDTTTMGGLKDVGTIGGASLRPEKVTLNPSDSYRYTAMPAEAVKAEVMANAGAGKISP
jgi:pectate lyase